MRRALKVGSVIGGAAIVLNVCGCSSNITKIVRPPYAIVMASTVRHPYAFVQGRILEKGGKEIEQDGQPWSVLVIEEGLTNKSVIDRTWIRATANGTNGTRIEVESVKDPAFTYWQTSRERRRLREFLKDLE